MTLKGWHYSHHADYNVSIVVILLVFQAETSGF